MIGSLLIRPLTNHTEWVTQKEHKDTIVLNCYWPVYHLIHRDPRNTQKATTASLF